MHLLIYNPVAGNGTDELDKIQNLFLKYNIKLETLVTSEHNNLTETLDTYTNKYEAIIVAGGDGTVSTVINFLVKYKVETKLIIYPKGTSNEYADNFEITKNTLTEYLLGKYTVNKVDVGMYNESNIFIYSFAFGNYSHIPYETPQWLKNRVGYFAYWMYAFLSLYFVRIKRYSINFEADDFELDEKVLFGSVSNSKTLGRVINLDDVVFDDGYLELFIVKSPKSFKEVIGFIHDARTGEDTSGLLIHRKIKSLNVTSDKLHSWSADGEYSGKFENITIKVLEGAITIIN